MCMDCISDFFDPAPPASNGIRSEVFIAVDGDGLDLDYLFAENTLTSVVWMCIF